MKTLLLKFDYIEATKSLKGQFPDPTHVDQMIRESIRVLTPRGKDVAIYFRGVIPVELYDTGYRSWKIVKELPSNRATAVGSRSLPRLRNNKSLGKRRVLSKAVLTVLEQNGTAHGAIGYFDATPDKPCHKTPLTKRHPEMLTRNKLLIKVVDRAYREFLAPFYMKQLAEVEKSPDWRLLDTAFTTIYLAKNFRTAYHRDRGNLKGVMTALMTMGHFSGGELALPRWRIAFALKPGDLLFFDPQQLHGNLPIQGERLSAAFYCERRIADCGK